MGEINFVVRQLARSTEKHHDILAFMISHSDYHIHKWVRPYTVESLEKSSKPVEPRQNPVSSGSGSHCFTIGDTPETSGRPQDNSETSLQENLPSAEDINGVDW